MTIGRIICFLENLKSEILIDGRTLKMYGGCGYLAAAGYIDKAITTLITQQTEIEEKECKIDFLEKENNDYKEKYGEWNNEKQADV